MAPKRPLDNWLKDIAPFLDRDGAVEVRRLLPPFADARLPHFYVLEGHTPVPCTDLRRWCGWMVQAERRVAQSAVGPGVEVSTVFLGQDAAWGRAARPQLYETLVLGGLLHGQTRRYSTWEEAEAGHAAMVQAVRATLQAEDPR